MDFNAIFFMQVSNQVASAATQTVLNIGVVLPSTGKDEGLGANDNVVLFFPMFILTCNMIVLCTFMANTK